MYSNDNVRVRDVRARINALDRNIAQLSGSSGPPVNIANSNDQTATESKALYPPLRQLPRLAVPYADLYRQVQIQESIYSLLTQQYELARIQEAKDLPVISVIDSPGIPEKKSFPPRLILTAVLAVLMTASVAALLFLRRWWLVVDGRDPRKRLVERISRDVRRMSAHFPQNGREIA